MTQVSYPASGSRPKPCSTDPGIPGICPWCFIRCAQPRRAAAKYGETTAQTIVGRPSESEHRSGLAVDITDRYYEEKDSYLENTELFTWLKMHCFEYGFILRYPKDKKAVTGYVYEPWHFRYVGAEAAAFITENDLTLEEFLDLYRTS